MERSNVACSLCRRHCRLPSLLVQLGTREYLQKGLAGMAASHMEMLPFGEHPADETDAFAE